MSLLEKKKEREEQEKTEKEEKARQEAEQTNDESNLQSMYQKIYVIKIQSIVRMFLARCVCCKLVNERWEKIWDPTIKKYYYYDTIDDTSQWRSPNLLRGSKI